MLLDELKKFGLSQSEAKAYKALIGLKEARASDVAKLAKVPRNKIYFVMESLHAKGFVEIIPEKVMRFRAISFEHVFRTFLEDRQRRLKEMLKAGEKLTAELRNVQPEKQESGEFTIFRGRKVIYHRLNEILSGAKKSIFLCLDASELRNLHEVTRSKKSVDIVTHVDRSSRSMVKRWERFGNIKHHESIPPTKIAVIDQKEVFLFHLNPPTALYSNDPNFASMILTLAAALKRVAVPAADKITEIETGQIVDQIRIIKEEDLAEISTPRQEICVISTENMESTKRTEKTFQKAKQGMQIRILCPVTRNNMDIVKKDLAEIRHIEKCPMRLIILDDKQCLLQQTGSEGPWIFSQSGEFVASMKVFFEKLWENATPARARLDHLERQMKRESLLRFADVKQ